MEKDINLSIALKLQSYLEQADAYVIMTRLSDEALGDRKVSDMAERREITNTAQGDLLISIHQNSYNKPEVEGTQTFYYSESEQSRILAESIQNKIKTFLGQENNRNAKSNNDYFVLKQTTIPAVIVECGFLSNPEEGLLLASEEYQDKLAWAIYMGILDYFNTQQ